MITISRRIHSHSLPALCLVAGCASLLLGGCGGGGGNNGGGGGGGGTNPTTYTLSVNSSNPSSGVAITASPADNTGKSSGSSSFTLSYNSGTAVTVTAPATAGGNNFSSWNGCTSVSGANCSVTVSSNMTITANYTTPVAVAPTVGVTPTPATITTAQSLSVAISVVGTNGGATPTGSVVLTSGTYTSAATTLSNGSATINVAAGSLAAGSDTLTATYTPDSASSAAYKSASGTANITVTALPSPTMSAALNLTSITTVQTLTATVTLSGASGMPTPTGSVALSGGGLSNPISATLSSGVAVITIPAGSLAAGMDTLTVTYTPDAGSSSTYSSATKTASVTVSYAVIVNSSNPASGVAITISPNDVNGHGSGSSPISLAYASGTTVTLTAPATAANGNTFSSWTGCSSTSGTPALTCTLNVTASTTLTANYATPAPTVTVAPAGGNVTIGGSQQFTTTVTGGIANTVTWSVAVASGTGSAGTISSAGLYQTPYPAPATVTITATSTVNTSVSGSTTVTLVAPTTTAGPAVSVDAGTVTRAISPLIYGVNAYLLDATSAQNANITLARWGGDDTSRYNYQTNVVNSANDYFFENFSGSNSMLPDSPAGSGTNFNDFMTSANTLGIATIGTAPVIGWVSNSTVKACSFPKSYDANQKQYNGDNCGNGVDTNGTSLSGNNTIAMVTSNQDTPPTAPGAGNNTSIWAASTWIGGWIDCLTTKGAYCASGPGKDATIWDLDNEPEYWSAVHRDVHPTPMTYDEITNGGIGTALAIKAADSSALTSGPIISGWYQYFYSQQDVNNGYGTSPCYAPWAKPTDRQNHGGVPLIEYYIQQMSSASDTYNVRLLDYVDIHAYYAASYNGSSVAFTTAGDTGEQQARMNSTRVFWDTTYTDPSLTQPNYPTDANYDSTNCNIPLVAPQIIPRLQSWASTDWTSAKFPQRLKTAIDEYNFGGTESINGAVTQADVLGIFGKYGLDMATFWPQAQYASQIPGNMAFAIYRNYDGNKSTFGDQELSSTTGDQSKLAVYAASRTSDGAVTVVVINKTYGPLTNTLSVANLSSSRTVAHVYQYSNANLTAIVAQPDLTITAGTGSNPSTFSETFPAQSITMIVIP